jgi:TatD DNase family protein
MSFRSKVKGSRDPVSASCNRHPFIDTHAHLDDPRFAEDLDACLVRAREAGLVAVITVGTDLSSSETAFRLARHHPDVYAAVGIHPHEAASAQPEHFERLAQLLREPEVVAVGETGLDFYRDLSPRPLAEAVFRRHLELALDGDRPVIIHSRQAHDAVLNILEALRQRPRALLHSFDGSLSTARRAVELGLHLSFTGVLTYPSAEPLRRLASQLPLDRLLIETDCPYLPPQAHRGGRNEPAYVTDVAQALADAHGLSLRDVARVTTASARAVFALPNR